MKRFWTRSLLAMLVAAIPLAASAQEPTATDTLKTVDVLKPVDVVIASTAPLADPSDELESLATDVYALASGDLVTLRATLEPTSPSDSQNDPTQTTTTWVAQAAPARDAFEERVARLEAQVAALAAMLKSNASVTAPTTTLPAAVPPVAGTLSVAPAPQPRVAIARNAPSVALTRSLATTVAPNATYSYSLARSAPAAATTSPGAPIVIHIYVHGATGAPAPAVAPAASTHQFYYSVPLTTAPVGVGAVTPSIPMTTAPVRVRARAVPATPAAPGVAAPAASANPVTLPLPAAPQLRTRVLMIPGTPGAPAVPAIRAVPATSAVPAVPALPALPALPGVPAAPAAAPAPPATAPAGSLTPTSTSRIAWDDVPVDEK